MTTYEKHTEFYNCQKWAVNAPKNAPLRFGYLYGAAPEGYVRDFKTGECVCIDCKSSRLMAAVAIK